jgi:Holliday junction DNA helicase RuvA
MPGFGKRCQTLIAYIKGKLEYKHNDYIIVESNGIGYRINTALSSIEASGPVGSEVKVYTYLYVREDIISLYGFMTHEELNMFELLITVSGIGPKVAVSLISTLSPSKFSLAVITGDVKTLTKAPGIGNKTAQRLILELKDKINKEQLAAGSGMDGEAIGIDRDNSRITEAISALMVLGYTALEASKAVSSVYSDDMDLESIIKHSLKSMIKG